MNFAEKGIGKYMEIKEEESRRFMNEIANLKDR
jgi:hypothetical protein